MKWGTSWKPPGISDTVSAVGNEETYRRYLTGNTEFCDKLRDASAGGTGSSHMPNDFTVLYFLQAFYANIKRFDTFLLQLCKLFDTTKINRNGDYDSARRKCQWVMLGGTRDRNEPGARWWLIKVEHLQNGEDTRRYRRGEGIIQGPNRLGWWDSLHMCHLLDIGDESSRPVGPESSVPWHTGKKYRAYSFSFIALSLPSLLQNSSKVASAEVCSLTLQHHAAPSPGPLGRE